MPRFLNTMTIFRNLLKLRSGLKEELFALVFPIAIQNLILAAVAIADVIMLGRVSQTALSGASLAGQVQFLLNMVYFGLTSALGILVAQYWGKGDTKTIGRILGIGIIISAVFAGAFGVFCRFFPGTAIRIWTNVPELIDAGQRYLKIVAISYFFQGISQPYMAVIKSIERVRMVMTVSVLTLGLNVVLNAVLIFGLLGMPAMGIEGAALATVIARGFELAVYLIDFILQKTLPRSPFVIFSIPRLLVQDFIRYSLPAFVNDALWALAFNVNSMIMGRLGSDIVAANSVVSVARELVSTVGFAISAGAAILLGKEIGENRIDLAREDGSAILRVSFFVSVIAGAILAAATPFIPSLVRLTDIAASYLTVMLLINVVYQMMQVIDTVFIVSIFRCGGESKFGMYVDMGSMWGWLVPVGLISAFVLKLPPLIVYAIMCTDEVVKMPFCIWHYRKGTWARNITRDY